MPEDDRELIVKSQNGDVAAFESLVKQHQVVAYNVALKILGNQEDAKDATQEALIKVFKNLASFKAEAQFSTWLYRIVVNTCNDYLRKERSRKHFSLDKEMETEDGTLKREVSDDRMTPEKVYEANDLREKVQMAIQALPEQQRTVVVLRDIEGMSYDVIASMLDLPVGTVKSRINRGRDALKQMLIDNRVNAYGFSG